MLSRAYPTLHAAFIPQAHKWLSSCPIRSEYKPVLTENEQLSVPSGLLALSFSFTLCERVLAWSHVSVCLAVVPLLFSVAPSQSCSRPSDSWTFDPPLHLFRSGSMLAICVLFRFGVAYSNSSLSQSQLLAQSLWWYSSPFHLRASICPQLWPESSDADRECSLGEPAWFFFFLRVLHEGLRHWIGLINMFFQLLL